MINMCRIINKYMIYQICQSIQYIKRSRKFHIHYLVNIHKPPSTLVKKQDLYQHLTVPSYPQILLISKIFKLSVQIPLLLHNMYL